MTSLQAREARVSRDANQRALWADPIRKWSAFLQVQGLSDITVRKYRRTVVNFVADTLLDLNAVTQDDIVSYVVRDPITGQERPRNGGMRGEILRALRSYYSWAEDAELCVNPARKLKPRNPKYGDAPVLEWEELCRLVYAAAMRDPRRGWTLVLAYSTGARIGSLCALEARDLHNGRLHFRRAKGDRPYSIPAVPAIEEAFNELASYHLRTVIGVTPARVRQWLSQAEHDTGIHAWPHLFRHTFATDLAPLTDLRTWMDLMNHADPSQYRRYTHRDGDRERTALEGITSRARHA